MLRKNTSPSGHTAIYTKQKNSQCGKVDPLLPTAVRWRSRDMKLLQEVQAETFSTLLWSTLSSWWIPCTQQQWGAWQQWVLLQNIVLALTKPMHTISHSFLHGVQTDHSSQKCKTQSGVQTAHLIKSTLVLWRLSSRLIMGTGLSH